MDVVQLHSETTVSTERSERWVMVALSLLLLAVVWWVNDLWRVMTWPRHQLEMDGAMSRGELLSISLFAFVLVLIAAVITIVARMYGWYFAEWAMPMFVLGFLYSVTTYIRISR